MALVIESLTGAHKRSEFCCSNEELNCYIKYFANQDQKRRLCSCYVLADEETCEVIGFYTLTPTSIRRELIEHLVAPSKLGRYEFLPAVLLGRLAVDQSHEGKGLGKFLLRNAIERAYSNELGGVGMLVEAKDQKAMEFYLKNQFDKVEELTGFLLFVSHKSYGVQLQ